MCVERLSKQTHQNWPKALDPNERTIFIQNYGLPARLLCSSQKICDPKQVCNKFRLRLSTRAPMHKFEYAKNYCRMHLSDYWFSKLNLSIDRRTKLSYNQHHKALPRVIPLFHFSPYFFLCSSFVLLLLLLLLLFLFSRQLKFHCYCGELVSSCHDCSKCNCFT